MSRALAGGVGLVLLGAAMGLVSPAPAEAWRELSDPPRRARTVPYGWQLDETRCGAEAGGPGVAQTEDAVRTGIERWTALGSGWSGSYDGRTSGGTDRDGDDQFYFLRSWDPALGDPSAILAVAAARNTGDGPVFTVIECDVIFNGDVYEWTSGSARRRDGGAIGDATVLNTVLHEVGHCLGLGHSERSDAVMRPSGGTFDAPQADDRAGALALYPPGEPLCTSDGQCPAMDGESARCGSEGMCEPVPAGAVGTYCDNASAVCEPELECRGNVCTKACTDHAQCGGGTFCNRFENGSYCWPPGPTELGGACTYSTDCQSTLCVSGSCAKPCDADCICPIGQRCAPLSDAWHYPGYCTEGESTCVRCGDGLVGGDEGCDEGAANDDFTADRCRTDCSPARCGDFVIDAGEECDDGNVDPGDGCSATCAVEGPAGDGGRLGDGGVAASVDGSMGGSSAAATRTLTGGCAVGAGAPSANNGLALWALLLVAWRLRQRAPLSP